MNQVSVDTANPSPYLESDSRLYRFKRRLTYSFAFRLLDRFARPASISSILEVGTGSGFFLSFAKDHFPGARLFGVEYDERLLAATAARAPFAQLMQGNAEQFELDFQRFDLVVSFQVIEHLYSPAAMLERVRSHLRPGGLFLVTTPNLTGLGANVMGQKWHGYRDDHVSLKGKTEWEALIESHGFERLYSGSTFFSGIPFLNSFPLGVFNWLMLVLFGSWQWSHGESYVGLYKSSDSEK